MTAFVESCVGMVTGTANAVARRSRGRPRARHLLRTLADKKNILITTHEHPDPDALASAMALRTLLAARLAGAKVTTSIKGRIGGGLNAIFTQLTDLNLSPWDDAALKDYDAILLLDTQPPFANNPLPKDVEPAAVIDHHRSRGRSPKCAFCDIRPDVGATSSIIFSYFMETELRPSPDLAAFLLFAIESDLAGAAGQPGELDNIALSSLTLIADTHKLYKMRYVDLPQGYYVAYAQGLNNALYYDSALMSHLESMNSPEIPAVIADFLLRFDQVQWSLVTALNRPTPSVSPPAAPVAPTAAVSPVPPPILVMSLRTNSPRLSAADLMRRLVKHIGEGGGHRTKAGGFIKLETGSPTEIDRVREVLRRRYLRALKIKSSRGQRLVPKPC